MVKIRSVMTPNVITVHSGVTIEGAAKIMVNKSVDCLVVVKEKKPIGVLTDHDLVTEIAAKKFNPKKIKVKEIMNKEFIDVSPEAKFSKVSRMLRKQGVKIFPVVKAEELVGIVTETDILRATNDFAKMHHIMQEVLLLIFGLVTAFFLFYFSPFNPLLG